MRSNIFEMTNGAPFGVGHFDHLPRATAVFALAARSRRGIRGGGKSVVP